MRWKEGTTGAAPGGWASDRRGLGAPTGLSVAAGSPPGERAWPADAAREGGTRHRLTDLPDELDLDALVFQTLIRMLECEAHLPGDRLSVVEEEILLLLPVLRLVLGPLPTLRIVQHDLYLHALPEAEEAHLAGGPARPALGGWAALRQGQRTRRSARRGARHNCPLHREDWAGPAERPEHRCTAAPRPRTCANSWRRRGAGAAMQL